MTENRGHNAQSGIADAPTSVHIVVGVSGNLVARVGKLAIAAIDILAASYRKNYCGLTGSMQSPPWFLTLLTVRATRRNCSSFVPRVPEPEVWYRNVSVGFDAQLFLFNAVDTSEKCSLLPSRV